MANPKTRVPENVAGDFFVDATCIDCDACRQIAPHVFAEAPDHAYVYQQPAADERRRAFHALLSCPTGSIGYLGSDDRPTSAMRDFPLVVEDPVYYCGFNSPKSYGGSSYLIRHPQGNWLVDAPKFIPTLVRQLEALGGVANIFLTHQDDVADAHKYAHAFGARRFIHVEERAAQPDAEVLLHGAAAQGLADHVIAIPTPGHTRGHCVLLFDDRFLFTGDHLAWDRAARELTAFRDYCWFSWPEQIHSMQKLLEFEFEWVLPGHGQRVQLPRSSMREELARLVERMKVE